MGGTPSSGTRHPPHTGPHAFVLAGGGEGGWRHAAAGPCPPSPSTPPPPPPPPQPPMVAAPKKEKNYISGEIFFSAHPSACGSMTVWRRVRVAGGGCEPPAKWKPQSHRHLADDGGPVRRVSCLGGGGGVCHGGGRRGPTKPFISHIDIMMATARP